MSNEDLIAKARKIDELFYVLVQDVIDATTIWKERDDAFSHRLYVRTVFAFAEGIIQIMKSAALLRDEVNDPHRLSSEEITLLKEEEIQIGSRGEVELKKKKISLLPNFQFALLTYAK